ncbi:MAG: 3-methyl-2-oxobutanoate hydroxymethyltransferase [Brachymonas denitrificans]|uniref:3-methyl-2-oxobutanoate hydroxymethyltransferase n=1 Tax=Brachymonas denitrificans TaxID=28220 RepID=UPI001BCF6F8D|nr:3-methyl-2-oxobutanoate hydroxymethyltransferase [Brachymonas denitrificans]
MKHTITTLQKMKAEGNKIAMLTCYDASFASLMSQCGVDMLLVGDSLGMVVQGAGSTLPVTLDDMVYHTRCVARGAGNALVLADLPFGSYQQSKEQAFASSVALMQAGAEMVKLEGGAFMAETIAFLVARGIPVCAHIGLTPQSVNTLGGYRVQGRDDIQAALLLQDARILTEAGAHMLLMEMVPAALAGEVSRSIAVPTIGIGAGPDTDGQVLVVHDMLDVYPGKKARFVKNFMAEAGTIQNAVTHYVQQVKAGSFPAPEHCY